MPGLQVPQGELETLGIGAETTFGTLATPTIWHCFKTFTPKTTIDAIARAPRASLSQPLPGTGGRSVAMSLDVEPDEDTFPQLLAYTMGAQTNPSTALYSTTLTAACTAGNTSIVVASALFAFAGLIISVGGTTPENVTVASVGGSNGLTLKLKTALANNHANGAAVTATGGPNQHLIKMTQGTPLPSFSLQLNRPGSICTDYLGSAVDQLTLSCAMKQGLQAKFSLVAQNDVVDGSPTAATLSTLNPYIFEQQNTFAFVGGELLGNGSNASLLSFTITINNNLNKSNWTFGNGNLVRSFPEQLRKVSGQMQLYFESQTQLNNFNAAQSGGNLPPISALIPLVGTDNTGGAGSTYAIGIWMPSIFLQTLDIGDDTSKAVTQSYSFTCGESVPGANDSVAFYCIVAPNAKY